MREADAASVRVLTVDDHPVFRDGFAPIVHTQWDMLLVAEGEEIAQPAPKRSPSH